MRKDIANLSVKNVHKFQYSEAHKIPRLQGISTQAIAQLLKNKERSLKVVSAQFLSTRFKISVRLQRRAGSRNQKPGGEGGGPQPPGKTLL